MKQHRASCMNDYLRSFIEAGKRLAASHGLKWDFSDPVTGAVMKSERWNLTALAGQFPPPTLWLAGFDFSAAERDALLEVSPLGSQQEPPRSGMTGAWADLCKAVVLDEILVKRNKPQHALINIARPLRFIALCAQDTPPSDVNPDQIKAAYNLALRAGTSGKVASNLKLVVKNVLDARQIANLSPLTRYCIPSDSGDAGVKHASVLALESRANTYRRTDKQRKDLSDRKGANRLPDESAFWEPMRIVYTEQPKSFSDAVRFEQLKIGIATGMRIGETVLLPDNCLLSTKHIDAQGRSAGESGGVGTTLSLRYFAEKQHEDEAASGVVLYESLQHVPALLTDMVRESVERARRLTNPLRTRLRQQVATGRIFPEFGEDELLPVWDMYTRLSGSIHIAPALLPAELTKRYRETYDADVLEEIREWQQRSVLRHGPSDNVVKYWSKFFKTTGVEPVNLRGKPFIGRTPWSDAYLKVGIIERAVRQFMPTKLSDTYPIQLKSESINAADLLFLMPIRSVIEGRNGGIADVSRYAFVGRASSADMQVMLGGAANGLFARYGRDDEARSLKMVTHSIRHLQNAELFRVGVSDAIITKRFGRRSVTQSHAYDHRSLAEDLAHIELPRAATDLGDRTKELAKLIIAKKVSGPIIDEFLKIQAKEGDQAAFEYLEAEADGLHVTPYGLCVNSFVVDPCPKHLECFNGCRHLTRTNVVSERENLGKLLNMTIRVETGINAVPEVDRNVGWENQLASIRTRVKNIQAVLNAEPDTRPFPDGDDLFRSVDANSHRSILDVPPPKVVE